ncbi:TPA: hypothetical protein DEP21_04870 [Patescibacteria group bacterium]|nr:hypothetical protein [Candidatus Gracilibacteria bacterium]
MGLHSPLKYARSSQDEPFVNVHIPYCHPVPSLIVSVQEFCSQKTEAGFAIVIGFSHCFFSFTKKYTHPRIRAIARKGRNFFIDLGQHIKIFAVCLHLSPCIWRPYILIFLYFSI